MYRSTRGGFRRLVLTLWVLTGFCFSAAPISVYALASGGIGGYPANHDSGIQYSDSWFIYNLDLGESKNDAVLLQNSTDQAQTIKLYAVDSVATGDGNFSLRQEQDPREGIGSWINLGENLITLNPSEERTIPFTITIPDKADAGEHSGGIIIQKSAAPEAGGGSAGASIVTRVGIRVYETVPGKIVKKLEVTDFTIVRETPKDKKPLYRINLVVDNKSNISLKAHATLRVSGWGKIAYFPNSQTDHGMNIDLSDFVNFFKGDELSNNWQLLRGQKVTTNWEWPEPAFGHYTFQAIVTYDGENGQETIVSSVKSITVIPWTLIIIFLSIVVTLVIIGFVRSGVGRKKRWKTYRVQPGDQLAEIAKKAKVSWKRLAVMNKLKEPIVHAGQDILVPVSFLASQKDEPQEPKAPKEVSRPVIEPQEEKQKPMVTKKIRVRPAGTVKRPPTRKPSV